MSQRLAPMMLPENIYKRVVDAVALELWRCRTSQSSTDSLKQIADSKQRLLHRKMARRVIDFARDHGPLAQCVVCGCTDAEACPGGCAWVVVNRFAGKGVCSSCVEDLEAR